VKREEGTQQNNICTSQMQRQDRTLPTSQIMTSLSDRQHTAVTLYWQIRFSFFLFSDTIQADCFSNQKNNKLDRTFLITLIINNVNNVEKKSTFDIKYLYR